jgi:RecQ family ATP-dependent DNA helicase
VSAAALLDFPAPDSEPLSSLLHRAFGFPTFRANQEAVCQAAVAGQDLLLVMPTGSGKSLCYQLPAIARGGTALVVSPLIALMEDQVAKLAALGFAVARIHSGLDRAVSRQACVEYLQGRLQFLFIAPERLRVPGFPEMLAKRKPTLIAIDEAHCISQWGHDFRPDYRMLGQYLPALRPAPVLALTATATPAVQRDIVTQLGLTEARKFIHGFRRSNLAIEVVEVPMPMRADLAGELLKDPARRPAIVYAPARKRAEALAAQLSQSFPAAAYHAGLPAEIREDVQRRFQTGELDCVVATIAFGMGIDKANIRTVIHVALPATLEGYYQEIGRAGRDGLPSRTILMHSYADMRTHEFFFDRDYPPAQTLQQVCQALTAEPRPMDEIRAGLGMDEEAFSKAMEKLYIHGGAEVDFANNATRGHDRWLTPYTRQSDYRRAQLALVQRYVEGQQCRMAALVQHFGDVADGQTACGLCDFCRPAEGSARQFHEATRQEEDALWDILNSLRGTTGKSLGRLLKEVPGNLTRKELDHYLGALAKAGLVTVEDAEWIKDGETILFRKASATAKGEGLEAGSKLGIRLPSAPGGSGKTGRAGREPAQLGLRDGKEREKKAAKPEPALTAESQRLEQVLKEWRTGLAKRQGVPPFVILHDRTLREIAAARPGNLNELLAITGMGPTKVDKYGSQIVEMCQAE